MLIHPILYQATMHSSASSLSRDLSYDKLILEKAVYLHLKRDKIEVLWEHLVSASAISWFQRIAFQSFWQFLLPRALFYMGDENSLFLGIWPCICLCLKHIVQIPHPTEQIKLYYLPFLHFLSFAYFLQTVIMFSTVLLKSRSQIDSCSTPVETPLLNHNL